VVTLLIVVSSLVVTNIEPFVKKLIINGLPDTVVEGLEKHRQNSNSRNEITYRPQ
jgi:hypothetical protein